MAHLTVYHHRTFIHRSFGKYFALLDSLYNYRATKIKIIILFRFNYGISSRSNSVKENNQLKFRLHSRVVIIDAFNGRLSFHFTRDACDMCIDMRRICQTTCTT